MSGINKLAATIAARAAASPDSSYTAKLLAGGIEKCAKKFGEEAFELAMAAVQKDKAHTVNEAADVIYHLLVLLQASGVSLAEVEQVLASREAMSGLEEKAKRDG
ncbi:phosphoribosyl-ATP diphosphatase [Aestuariivirga litoralis]|uniref:phosphoribosyl-ATP diphosphatase n=1 Tax=Aestuariivirga litoralis TaxID=2650924 RepID=UPI0018C5D594|nr:phosphoribosyl-ATP diphosphatase [Aestuariivirga litoralis]MBG1232732.1 phosphoribosyl-ATP diphosphatase [Aestuariivirga litoralis]